MSPRRNWDPCSHSSPAGECALAPRGWVHSAHSPAGRCWGSPYSDDWTKSLALCLLCLRYSEEATGVCGKTHQLHFYIPWRDYTAVSMQSGCPIVGMRSPQPPPPVCLPSWTQREGKFFFIGRGGDPTQFRRLGRKPGTMYIIKRI
jgi:hypothetical protein